MPGYPIKNPGTEHPYVAALYFAIGDCFKSMGKYAFAIDAFNKGFQLKKLGGFPFKIAQSYEALKQFKDALNYYIQSAEIRKGDPSLGIAAPLTQETIADAQRLAKQLGLEKKLPKWME